MERGLGVLLEKMMVLDRVERALQRVEETEHPNLDRGKEAACDTQIPHPTGDLSGVFRGGGGFKATSAPKNSPRY